MTTIGERTKARDLDLVQLPLPPLALNAVEPLVADVVMPSFGIAWRRRIRGVADEQLVLL